MKSIQRGIRVVAIGAVVGLALSQAAFAQTPAPGTGEGGATTVTPRPNNTAKERIQAREPNREAMREAVKKGEVRATGEAGATGTTPRPNNTAKERIQAREPNREAMRQAVKKGEVRATGEGGK